MQLDALPVNRPFWCSCLVLLRQKVQLEHMIWPFWCSGWVLLRQKVQLEHMIWPF